MEYEIITLDDGRQARKYPDGSFRETNGQIIKPPTNAKQITSANAREMRIRRQEVAKRKALEALRDGTGEVNGLAGWKKILIKRVQVALENDQRPGNDATKLIGQAAGLLSTSREENQERTIRHEYTIDDDTLNLLESIVKLKQGKAEPKFEVVDGISQEVKDG